MAQSTPPLSTALPTSLPPSATLPPGVTPPTGVTLPSYPPSTLGGLTETLVQQFLAQGRLPAGITAQDVQALLGAPSSELPPQLAELTKALSGLASAGLDGPLASDVACTLASAVGTTTGSPDLTNLPWAQAAVGALSTTGALSGVFKATSTGGFGPGQQTLQWQWVALVMRGVGALPSGNGLAAQLGSPSSVVRLAVGRGLFPPGGGVTPSPRSTIDVGQAVTLLTRALGLGGLADQLGALAPSSGLPSGTPRWAGGAMTLAHGLGLLDDIGLSATAPLTRADAVVLLARSLGLYGTVVDALDKPTLTGVSPGVLGPGMRAALSGSNFGQVGGTVAWRPRSGATQMVSVVSWSTSVVTVQLPEHVASGPGELVLLTKDGAVATAAAEVAPPAFRVVRDMPGGQVDLASAGHNYYVKPTVARALLAMPASAQLQWSRKVGLVLGSGSTEVLGVAAPERPALSVHPIPASHEQRELAASVAAANPCVQGCETLYGPGVTPYSPGLSSTQVTYDVPCATVLGYNVCSGWADASSDLGGVVGGYGDPTGYFTQVGAALSGASLVTGGTMDATLGLSYAPKYAGDLVVVNAKVITDQVDGGVGVAGAGTAPVHVYANAGSYGTEESTVASRLSTMSASVASWPDLSSADLAEQALSKLDAINDTAQTLWQLEGLPGEIGTGHVSSFSWSGTGQAGQDLQVSIDTQAVVASNGLAQTEVNAVSGVVLVKITELAPAALPASSGAACIDPPGVSGRLAISSVTPASGTAGTAIVVRGTGFGRVGQLAFYNPVIGTETDAVVQSWEPDEVRAAVPYMAPGQSQLFVFPTPYSCSTEVPAAFDMKGPTVTATTLSLGQPVFTVTGDGFGPGPCAQHVVRLECMPGATASTLGAGTVSLQLVKGPGGGLPAEPLALNATPYVTSWSNGGFTVLLGPLLGHMPLPGTYRVVLTRRFSDHGWALAEVHPRGTSASSDFVWASHWPQQDLTVTRDLGLIALPATLIMAAHAPGSGSQASPGGSVVVSGTGFGAKQGSVVLVGWASSLPPAYYQVWPTGPRAHVVGAQDIATWSNTRVVFSVPAGLAPGNYAVWVLNARWGPWAVVGDVHMISVAAPGRQCAAA